ncbi:hypothetical protein JOQ06_000898, partial [Pogonophryne albipinna]
MDMKWRGEEKGGQEIAGGGSAGVTSRPRPQNVESKLEAEREQWNMHRCWGILLLYWELWEGSGERKSI